MKTVACGACKTRYLLNYDAISMRDRDSLDCPNCGEKLYSWNETKIWYIVGAVAADAAANAGEADEDGEPSQAPLPTPSNGWQAQGPHTPQISA